MVLQVFKFYLSNIFKYFFWQVKLLLLLLLLESFSENVNLIKQKNSKSINMIILKFTINIHNY